MAPGLRMTNYPYVPLGTFEEYPLDEMRQRLAAFYESVDRRRTVRDFSGRPVPVDIIENALRAASTAPSGASSSSHSADARCS